MNKISNDTHPYTTAKNLVGLLSVLLFILFYACRKDKDTQPPAIQVSYPLNNASFNAADTIVVKATFTDDKNLEYVSVKLENDQNVSAAPSKTFNPYTDAYTMQTTYVLGDVHTPSGKYTLDFVAFDGTNTKHEFIDIYLNEVPKKLNKVLLITGSTSATGIYDFNNGNPQLLAQFQGNAVNAYADNRNQQLWLLHNHSEIKLLETSSYSTRWSDNESCSISFPCITASGFFNDELFYSTYYQKTVALDAAGSGKFTVSLPNGNEFSEYIFADNDLVLTEIKNYSNSTVKLNVYYRISSALKQSYDYTYNYTDIVSIVPYTNNEYLVLLNDNSGKAALLAYNTLSNSNWTPKTLPAAAATNMLAINSNEVLMTIGNTTYQYFTGNNSLLTYLNQAYQQLFYEPLNNELYGIINNQIDVYDYPSKQLKFSTTLSDTPKKIVFLYNK